MSNSLCKFPPEVVDELKFYVYRLIDPRDGNVFYVGKGKGNRLFSHMLVATSEANLDEISDKLQTIRDIIASGLEVIHIVHRHGLDEHTALQVEEALIDAYPGITNISGGTGSNYFGPMNAFEILNWYAAEEAKFKHNVIMINISRSKLERSIYDATRYAWKVNKLKAENQIIFYQ